jgi:hypothetical protein
LADRGFPQCPQAPADLCDENVYRLKQKKKKYIHMPEYNKENAYFVDAHPHASSDRLYL